MTPTTKQNYSYAINEDNTLIHVNTAVRGGMYTCPYCGGEMTPHMGKIRKWHFTHKANLQNCNYETYLHKIAKARIKAAFDNNPHFYIQYDVPVHCDKFDCDVADCKECRTIQYMSFRTKNGMIHVKKRLSTKISGLICYYHLLLQEIGHRYFLKFMYLINLHKRKLVTAFGL